jgi:hypothetical protein
MAGDCKNKVTGYSMDVISEARPVAFQETASGSQEPSSRFCRKPPVSASEREV